MTIRRLSRRLAEQIPGRLPDAGEGIGHLQQIHDFKFDRSDAMRAMSPALASGMPRTEAEIGLGTSWEIGVTKAAIESTAKAHIRFIGYLRHRRIREGDGFDLHLTV